MIRKQAGEVKQGATLAFASLIMEELDPDETRVNWG